MKLEADAVRAALTGTMVLDFYAPEVRGGRPIRECPRCKRRQRRIACVMATRHTATIGGVL